MGRNYRGVPVDLEIPERLDHPARKRHAQKKRTSTGLAFYILVVFWLCGIGLKKSWAHPKQKDKEPTQMKKNFFRWGFTSHVNLS